MYANNNEAFISKFCPVCMAVGIYFRRKTTTYRMAAILYGAMGLLQSGPCSVNLFQRCDIRLTVAGYQLLCRERTLRENMRQFFFVRFV